jgi:HSP20 family protein
MTRENDPFDDDNFNDVFEEMFERMNEMMDNMGAQGGFGGFRMTGGPDGADFETFGDANPFAGGGFEGFEGAGTHVDVLDEGDEVRVVADLPGVEKDEIRVAVSGDRLKIQASGDEREYDERVELPAEVDDETGEATYNNGVLEIVFDKVDDTENDKEIEVE